MAAGKERFMAQEDQINRVLVGMQRELERNDQETRNLDRLVVLADTDGLIRMGLGLMEAFAKVDGAEKHDRGHEV